MKAVREQICDTGQVGGSNEFPKVEAAEEHGGCNCAPVDAQHSVYCPKWKSPAPAAVAETSLPIDELSCIDWKQLPEYRTTAADTKAANEWWSRVRGMPQAAAMNHFIHGRKRTLQLNAAQQHIANLESELQMARDLITWKDARIAELEQQLTAANLGSSMWRERYGSY